MNARVASARSLLAAVLLVLTLFASAGCGGDRPGTIEDLYAELAALNSRGETGKMWDLYSDDGKKRMIDAIDSARIFFQRNPDPNEKFTRQYKCTRDEFMRLDYVELFRRENLGNERALIDSKIVAKNADVHDPSQEVLSIVTAAGDKVFMTARKTSRGWELVKFETIPRRSL